MKKYGMIKPEKKKNEVSKMDDIYTLAIDASTKATGIAVFKNNQLEKYKCIQCGKPNVLDRIQYMTEQIQDVYLNYAPEVIVMQDVLPEQVGHNQSVYKALIYLQAVIITMFHDYNRQVKLVVASHWRKQCGMKLGAGVKRQYLKQQSKNIVKGIYGIDVNDDISDAICLGLAEIKERNR